jgi:hypothetical protein
VSLFKDHSPWNFLDEKHLVNKDMLRNPNPNKPYPVDYMIGCENGYAASFVAFIFYLIATRYFAHGKILVMDNAAIHTGAEAAIVKDLLWDIVLDESHCMCWWSTYQLKPQN